MATSGVLSKLTRNQRRVIPHLLSERYIEDAAKAAGLGLRTVMRWLTEDKDFQTALVQAEGRAIDDATRALVRLADDAIETLRGVLSNPDASDTVKVRAANAVLTHLLKLRELRNVEQRLERLEAATFGGAQGPQRLVILPSKEGNTHEQH